MLNNIFDDEFLLNTNRTFKSKNQSLVGKPNPKTLVQPKIHPRITDLDHWGYSGLTVNSHINTASPWDTINSGYESIPNYESDVESESVDDFVSIGNPGVLNFNNFLNNPDLIDIPEDFSNLSQKSKVADINVVHLQHIQEDFSNLSQKSKGADINDRLQHTNTYDLPGTYKRKMSNYEKNLHTQNVQPDVFTYNDIIEPINSNIGISMTPQFTESSFITKSGIKTGTIGDPRPKTHGGLGGNYANESSKSVYDPRFTGSGSSHRGFSNPVTGSVDFYYDDVDSIRKPNYLVRSNIDFAEYASSSGSLQNLSDVPSMEDIRLKANDTFLQATLQQRDELMERLMRKRNAELAENRKFPKHLNGSRKS